jgi:hypothetical protein
MIGSWLTSGWLDVGLSAGWFLSCWRPARTPGGEAAVSDLLAGRAQMGTSLGFHIVFASLGVGLPVLIAGAHSSASSAATRSGFAWPSP